MAKGQEGDRDFWRVLLATFVPPVGVFMQVGLGGAFWLNVLLSLFFYIPGQLHALWVISTRREDGRPEAGGAMTFGSLLLAAWLPPVGVLLKRGVGVPLVLNCVLTAFFWIPGMVHAAWAITHDE